jgi:hypothetical protein
VLAVRTRSRFPLIAMAVTLIAGLLLLGNTAFAASNPPGNNGTVKIHEVPLDSRPHNQPHVDCPFTVSFFGFDQGDVAKVTFTAWAPTGKGKVLLTDTVDIGADDNSGGGSSAGFDGEKTYTLDFDGIAPHEQQGFHVKLTVTVTSPGSRTPKFNKYKVFWAQPCESSGGTTTTTTGGTTTTTTGGTTTTTSGGGTTTSTTTPGGTTTTTESGGTLPTSSLGGSSSSAAGGALPFTGGNSLPMIVGALALLALGAASVVASRRHGKSGA